MFIQEAQGRGFVYQDVHLDELLSQKNIVVYCGYDPTAKSLHVGNLTTIMFLKLIEKYGGKVIVLLGGATGLIGDPTMRDTQRQMLSQQTVQTNIDSIKKVFSRFLKNPTIVNNIDWLAQLNYINFLRDYGRFFSVNKMISCDSIKTRLEREQPLSFLEFNYMILQGYDYLHLNEAYGCNLQIGGSDQWSNILSGVDLIRRVKSASVSAITCPLITNSAGQKMGKTADGAVWLDEAMLEPFSYWQFWRNTSDSDIGKFLRIFTDLDLSMIEELEALEGEECNKAKIILADEATKLAHGPQVLDSIHQTAQSLFYNKSEGAQSLTLIYLDQEDIRIDELLVRVSLCQSKSEAKQKIQEGAVKLDDNVISDLEMIMITKNERIISVGKKKHVRICLKP